MVELANRRREAKVEEAKKMAEQEALDAKKATEANEEMQATRGEGGGRDQRPTVSSALCPPPLVERRS